MFFVTQEQILYFYHEVRYLWNSSNMKDKGGKGLNHTVNGADEKFDDIFENLVKEV